VEETKNNYMKICLKITVGLLLTLCISCDNSNKIKQLLKSKKIDEVIEGAWKAGESRDKQYVPLLLTDAGDQATSTMLKFKGYSIYEQKMYALQKIYASPPPVKITHFVDSTVIRFYENLAKKEHRW
jgi:hypothetical protein